MQTSRRNVLKALAATPVLLSPGLLAACSSGSSSKSGTLNVGQISDSVAFFPLFIAEKQGFFKDEGLTLGERPRLGTGAKVAAALKSGSIDLGGGVTTDALNLAEIDKQARITTALITEYYVDIVTGKGISGSGGTTEDKTRALKGAKIGITGPGSGTEALVNYLFEKVGLDPKTDATLVNLGSVSSAALGALKAGRVDALSFFQPIGQQAEAAGIGTIYISPAAGDVPSMKGALHGIAFGRSSVLTEKAKEVKSFNQAIDRSLDLIGSDESKTRELLGQYLKGTPSAALDSLVPILRKESAPSSAVAQKPYDIARSFHVESGLVKKAPSYDQIVPARFR